MELLVATAILITVFAAMISVFTSCIFLNGANRNLTIATSHAQFIMEQIKNTNFNNIVSQFGNRHWCGIAINQAFSGLFYLNGECIDITTGQAGISLLDVAVMVSWKDPKLRDRNIILETLIAKP